MRSGPEGPLFYFYYCASHKKAGPAITGEPRQSPLFNRQPYFVPAVPVFWPVPVFPFCWFMSWF